MMNKEKFCHVEGLKHVAGTSQMTNFHLLLIVQIVGLNNVHSCRFLCEVCTEAEEILEHYAHDTS
jgi:hypothetical protein